jgi:hypothetical protein
MTWLLNFLGALIPKILKEFIQKKSPTMEDGKSDGEKEKKLKDKIDEKW